MRVLLLGGTSEASAIAQALAAAGLDAVFSYAGRTSSPIAQPLPTRVGGFGGVSGLKDFLRSEGITHVVDATHPFAAGMSTNAVHACTESGVPVIALERPCWVRLPGDNWIDVPDTEAAVGALPEAPARVFLAIGRQTLSPFAGKRHHYLLRLVDDLPVPLENATVVVDRGPFSEEGDRRLMEAHQITHVVAKNAGGDGARAKIDAARALGLPVVMIGRPAIPDRPKVATPGAVMDWLIHARLGV